MEPVASVMMMGEILNLDTPMPFISPTRAPAEHAHQAEEGRVLGMTCEKIAAIHDDEEHDIPDGNVQAAAQHDDPLAQGNDAKKRSLADHAPQVVRPQRRRRNKSRQ